MKMVAASRLRRAQEQAEAARPYAQRMERVLGSLAGRMAGLPGAPPLLVGTGKEETHLIVVATSDRGLAGGFNASILREARRRIRELEAAGKKVMMLIIGRKGRDGLRRDYGRLDPRQPDRGRPAPALLRRGPRHRRARPGALSGGRVRRLHDHLQPFPLGDDPDRHGAAADPVCIRGRGATGSEPEVGVRAGAVYEFEPSEEEILAELLPKNLAVQIFTALLENAASEQGARMTAMDNATRNAGDMIDRLTLNYNRTRQAVITKELIEIISGAEAL